MAAMVKKPVTGMKDILPQEMAVRNYVTSLIRETYASFGFSSIETPAVEHIENLLSKQGGENEKLIFKILKRGEKLDLQNAKTEEDVADSGLRYDLTLPLARYYACHAADLPSPFKALQIGNVFRAERNQKGRFRQFTQCDIDILGDPSCFAEIDLILATSTVLTKLGFKGFRIRINDRAILKHMAAKAGFQESDFEKVFITIDKMDKIGMSGVREDLLASYPAEIVDSYLEGLGGASSSGDGFSERDEALMREVGSPLPEIIRTVMRVKNGDYSVVYDPTLVRGMGYYTGPIFEISMDEFGSSVGGGGRYDEMIGRFTGQKTPAVGVSIGFERIIMVLLEKHFEVPGEQDRAAFLIEKKMPEDRLPAIWQEAMELRAAGRCVDIAMMKKNRKFQKEQLAAEGYGEIREFFVNELL